MAKSLAKGDYDGVRAEVRKVMKQPDYDDGKLPVPCLPEVASNIWLQQDRLDLSLFGKSSRLRHESYQADFRHCISLAWHASGTFSLVEHNGGSNGAGLRHGKEAADPANAGMLCPISLPFLGTEQDHFHRSLPRHRLPHAHPESQLVDIPRRPVDAGGS